MVVLDEDFGTGLTLVEGNGGVRSSPVLVPERAPRDWRSQCERERARADAAEARAEELRWAEVASRSDAGSWKSRFKACRHRLSEAVEETKEARRVARDVPSLQAEVARLETLLSEAGVESNEDSTIEALRKENARLRKALAGIVTLTAWLRHGRCFSVSGCARYPTVVTAFHRSSSSMPSGSIAVSR